MRDLFRKRREYKSTTNYSPLNVFDNWDDHQFFYGKFNKRNRTIAPLDRSGMRQVANSDIFVVNFVADAFEELREYYARIYGSPTNSANEVPPIAGMSTLEAERGYIKPIGLYRVLMDDARQMFVKNYLIGQKIESSEQVIEKYLDFVRDNAMNTPMLYSTFVGSSSCPIHSSGLVVEVSLDPHDNDDPKYEFIENDNFWFFIDTVAKYGFVPARNAPWCLVANLQSPAMQQYASLHGAYPHNTLEEYYYECKDFDIDLMREFVYESFLELERQEYVETTHRICNNKTVTKNVLREPADLKQQIDRFENKEWMKIYLNVLLAQSGAILTPEKTNRLISDFMTVYEETDFEMTYNYVHSEIRKLPKSLDRRQNIVYTSASTTPRGATGGISGY